MSIFSTYIVVEKIDMVKRAVLRASHGDMLPSTNVWRPIAIPIPDVR